MELILLPLLAGILSFFIPKTWSKWSALLFGGLSVAMVINHLISFDPKASMELFAPQKVTLGELTLTFKMALDGIGFVMLALSNLVFFLVALANFNREEGSSPLFNGLMFLMQWGINGLFCSQDAVLFYMFWEFALIPIFLILYWFGAKDNQKNLLKFFVYTLFGSLFMLLSILAWASFSNSLGYDDLATASVPLKYSCWIFSGFLLAFAVKIPLFPFHTWQAPTYSTAPMAGTMLLSAIMLKMALFGMIKWMIPLNFNALETYQLPVIILGLIGILYGAFIAINETNIRKIFAYASLSHLGLIAAGIMLFTEESLKTSVLQMVNHSLIAVGLFLCADFLEKRFKTSDIQAMGGLIKQAPKFGFWFGVMVLVSLSVPLTAGFIGEFFLIKSLFFYDAWIGIAASLTLILGAVYMIRAFQTSAMGPSVLDESTDLAWNEWAVFSIIGAVTLYLGIQPNAVFNLIEPSIQTLLQVEGTTFNFF